jgi:hypothetical protein
MAPYFFELGYQVFSHNLMKWFFRFSFAMVVTPHQKHFHMRRAFSASSSNAPARSASSGENSRLHIPVSSDRDICPVLRR